MSKYVDIILPLALDGAFTYSVPPDLQQSVAFGKRADVIFGRSKHYAGIIVRLHDAKPSFKCKPILGLIDESPVILPRQYESWQWIASYYMCTIGDVLSAAFPAGMKQQERYRPRTDTYVSLPDNLHNAEALRVVESLLARSDKQLLAFSCFLTLSGWQTVADGTTASAELTPAEVSKEELLNTSKVRSSIVKSLVDKGMLSLYEKEVGRINSGPADAISAVNELSAAQKKAYDEILSQMTKHNVVLLHGVTSSGKTEIYIHLIKRAIERHEQVLYLLPEIALTVQITSRLRKVFGCRLGIYHSKYSDEERVEIWKKQMSSEPYDIILGARSAVLLPFQRLGLVIIDEEHETSFKQQDPAPRYHARSVAIMLARSYGARTLLGTATPSIDSYYNAVKGKYGYVSLTTRYKGIQLPQVQVVDVKDLRHRKMMNGLFSPVLLAAMRKALDAGRQVILFQNRRGFAPMIECRQCGWVPKCKNCDVSLTLHKRANLLTCHYCGATYSVPAVCPNCGSKELFGRGYGTEKIEDSIQEIFPEARVARMDLDTTRSRNAYSRIISDFAAGNTNILIGTQMVSKGLDFDNVAVVGILDADAMLNYPDFRSYEYAFSMMEQVSGRAGRKSAQGLVILQTRDTSLPVISQVVRHDYSAFSKDQLEERQLFNYPPFCHLVYVYLRHKHDEVVEAASADLGKMLRTWFGSRVLGPDKPSVARVKDMCIRKIVLKLENGIDLPKVRSYLLDARGRMEHDSRYGTVKIYFDVDPL